MDHTDFELAGGGTLGRDHRTSFRNYQDAYIIQQFPDCTIAIVTDGCSSGTHNEVGAVIGARFLIRAIHRQVLVRGGGAVHWGFVLKDLLSHLDAFVSSWATDFEYKRAIADHLLFTITGCLLTKAGATFFTLGDGLIFVNGKAYQAGPYNNKPPYAAYGLLTLDGFPDEDLEIQILEHYPLEAVDHFLIGCDGVVDLAKAGGHKFPGLHNQLFSGVDEFWEEDRYFSGNPDLISRQLRILARDWPKKDPEPGLLPDDTTLIVGRRK